MSEKICDYCNGKVLVTFDESPEFEGYVSVIKNELVISNDYGATAIGINFCPVCGKKLYKGDE